MNLRIQLGKDELQCKECGIFVEKKPIKSYINLFVYNRKSHLDCMNLFMYLCTSLNYQFQNNTYLIEHNEKEAIIQLQNLFEIDLI